MTSWKLRAPTIHPHTCSGARGVAWPSQSALRIAYSTAYRRARLYPTLGPSCPLCPKAQVSALSPLRSLGVEHRDCRARIGQPSVVETRMVSQLSHLPCPPQSLHRVSRRLLYQPKRVVSLVRLTGVSLRPLISRGIQSSRPLQAPRLLHRHLRHRVRGIPLAVLSLLKAVRLYRVPGALADVPGDVLSIALSIACNLSWTRTYRWSCDDA